MNQDKIKQILEKKERIKLHPFVKQMVQYHLAHYCVETKGSDLYHLMQSVEMLRVAIKSNIGEDILKIELKDDYPRVNKQLSKLHRRLILVKRFYDAIDTFDEDSRMRHIREEFEGELSEVKLINKSIYRCFIILLDYTDMAFMSIPNEYFKRMDKKEKILETEGRREPIGGENVG